jgi:hypothetical protein
MRRSVAVEGQYAVVLHNLLCRRSTRSLSNSRMVAVCSHLRGAIQRAFDCTSLLREAMRWMPTSRDVVMMTQFWRCSSGLAASFASNRCYSG